MLNEKIFKSYLLGKPGYKGGLAADKVKSKQEKIYKLSSNENAVGASPKAMKALEASLKDLHIYPDNKGTRLQDALAEFYDNELSPENFVATNSGSEIIEFIARCFLTPESEVIVSNPCFFPYTMFSTWNGAKVIDILLQKPNFSLDVDGILTAVNDKTRIIFITSPNNPTGSYLPKSDIDRIIDNIPDHVVLVLDEVYYHFADAPDFTTAKPYVLAGKNIIGVNSFSKTYGLAALRVGYCYSTPQIANYLRQLYRPFLINTLCMNAAIAALSDKEFINSTVELVRKERNRLYPILDKIGIKYWKSQANFILYQPEMEVNEFTAKMLEEGGVMVRPAGGFGAPNCVRVTIGTVAANDAFINGLRAIL